MTDLDHNKMLPLLHTTNNSPNNTIPVVLIIITIFKIRLAIISIIIIIIKIKINKILFSIN
jgi:hypothetical protein